MSNLNPPPGRRPISAGRSIFASVYLGLITLALLFAPGCGGSTSSIPAPAITVQPADQTALDGATATFSVTASGDQLSYQWSRNGAQVGGATAATFNTPLLTYASDANARFKVTVTNPSGTATSNEAKLTVTPKATVLSGLSGQAVLDGSAATFAVTANGTGPFTYQWKRGGVDLAGATSATFVTAPVAYALDHASTYTVAVTNGAGQTTLSASVSLSVTPKPTQLSGPVSQTILDGAPTAFSVSATGTGPFTYQWKRNGLDLPASGQPTLNLASVVYAADHLAQFSVVVTNGAGQATASAPATLSVTPKPTVLGGPADQSATDGATATFSVSASGTLPLAFQWKRGGLDIPGAQGPTYTTPALAFATDNLTQFSVVVTNGAGQVTASAPARLTVTPRGTTLIGPVDQTVLDGLPALFSVSALGSGPFTYQWKRNNVDLPGAQGTSYAIAAVVYAQDHLAQFSVAVTNAAGQVTTGGPASLRVTPKATLFNGPGDQTALDGATATFSVTASGTTPFTYQWRRGGVNLPGATAATYTTGTLVYATDNNAQFSVLVTNGAGIASASGNAKLTVTPKATVLTGPTAQTALDGATATFSVSASGTGPFSYQWQRGGVTQPGATGTSYTTAPLVYASDNGASFSVVVTNGAGQATSSATAALTVTPIALAFTTQPAGGSVVMGTTATLTCAVSGSRPVTYQWRKDGIGLAGQTSASLVLVNIHSGDAGTYSVAATGPLGTVISDDAVLTVTSDLSLATPPQAQTVIAPDGAAFSVVAGGTGPFTYQWKKNGTAIGGATASTYTTSATDLKMLPDAYSVVVGDGISSIESASVSFTVVAPHPFYLPGGQPLPVPSRPLTVLPSLHVDPVRFPNGAFMLGYDEALKNPAWTSYADFKVLSTFPNSTGDYQTDIRLEAPQVTKASMGTHGGAGFYLANGQGFDRGHMAMRYDVAYRYNQQAGDDATYMSNLVAQVSYYNQHLWNDLEEAVGGKFAGGVFDNGLTAIFGRTWVYTGPVFTGTSDYWVPSTEVYTRTPGTLPAGTLAIAIPTACYKIVVAEPAAGQTLPRVIAWMSANRSYATSESADIWKYTTSLQRVEELTGLDFFPSLPHDAALTALKASVDVRGWGVNFERATGPNVHILKPSWDLIPITGNPILKGDTVRMGDPVSFEANATPNKTGGTVDTTSACSWTFGDATGTTPGLTATHAYGTAGSFIATFSATDSLGQTNTITRVVTVVDPSNTPPAVTPSTLPNVTVRVGNPVPPVTFTVNDDATPAGSLIVTALSSDQTLVQDSNLVALNTGGSVSLAITPEAGQIGSATLTVTVTDGVGASTSKAFTFTVASNTPPVFTPSTLPDASTSTGTAKNVTFTVADDATAAGSITVTATSGNTTLLPDANISVSNVAGAITLILTPAAGENGTAVVTVTATDGDGASTVKTFTLTVAAASTSLIEYFDAGTKTAYTAADLVLPTGTWNLNDALLGNITPPGDRFNGTKSVRLRNGTVTMKFDFPNGAQTVTIQHAKYGSDTAGTWGLWYSTNAGGLWTKVGADVTSSGTTLAPAVFTVNINSPIRFEIRKTDANTSRRVCLDDFQITGY